MFELRARRARGRALSSLSAFGCVTLIGGTAWAQAQTLCIPGTPFCARTTAGAGIRLEGAGQGQVGPSGTTGATQGQASAGANANAQGQASAGANTAANANATVGLDANGRTGLDAAGRAGGNAGAGVGVAGRGGGGGSFENYQNNPGDGQDGSVPRRSYYSTPMRFGAGLALCGTVKAGVFSGIKLGPCFAVSFRTEPLIFEMETQLLFGGVRHSVDWVFPMSFVIPLTRQRSLYEGLQLRVGGSPIGVTFAKAENGGNYLRFGLHAGLSYEYDLGPAASWRVFDVRTFLDFGTRREVDLRHNFLDFGVQLSTGIVF